MIKLTRLDGEAFLLNAELIKYVEQRPDTFVASAISLSWRAKERRPNP